MIWLLDADLKGYTAIHRQIEAGLVKPLVCDTFMAYQAHCRALLTKVTSDDLVICDTFSNLLETGRFDARYTDLDEKLYPDADDLWKKRNIDDPYGRSYDVAGKFSLRWLKNLQARGARIITICHEAEVRDDSVIPPMKRRGPDVNDKLVNPLIGASTDLYRLEQLTEAMTSVAEDGTVTTLANVDDRILYLRSQPHFRAKFSCDIERSPKILRGMLNPTLPKLYEHLGVRPSWITLFGPSGVGKTTLAVSDAATPTN